MGVTAYRQVLQEQQGDDRVFTAVSKLLRGRLLAPARVVRTLTGRYRGNPRLLARGVRALNRRGSNLLSQSHRRQEGAEGVRRTTKVKYTFCVKKFLY